MRKVIPLVAVVLAGAGVAFVLLGRGAESTGKSEAPASPVAAAPAPPAVAAAEEAREKLAQVQRALENVPRPRKVTLSGPDRRPGESQAFYEERQRAIAEFNHFVRDGNLAPAQVEAVAGIIADAQETWKNGLAAAHRAQPEAPGAEMADPALSQLLTSLNEDAHRALREVVPPAQAPIVQSYFPSMLSYVRTQAFDTGK